MNRKKRRVRRAAEAEARRRRMRRALRHGIGEFSCAERMEHLLDLRHLRGGTRMRQWAKRMREILDDDRVITPELLELVDTVLRQAPRLAKRQHCFALLEIGRNSDWQRPLHDWTPAGQAQRAKMRSLLEHLYVRYPVPEFLYKAFWEQDEMTRTWATEAFVHVAGGGSFFEWVKARELMPRLSRRTCYRFLQSPPERHVIEALRRAQVLELGGEATLADAVVASRLGRGLHADEALVHDLLHWLCRHELDPRDVGPILDWVEMRRGYEPTFSTKGRTPRSVLRAVRQWHIMLGEVRAIAHMKFPSSGLAPLSSARADHDCDRDGPPDWEFVELASGDALIREGRALSHCVASYASRAARCTCTLWSLRRHGRPTLTLEIELPRRRLVQARGMGNRYPTDEEKRLVRSWSDTNRVAVAHW